MQGMGGGSLLSVAPEHVAALIATLVTPLAVWLLLTNARLLARDGADLAQSLVQRLDRLSGGDRLALLLMLTTGVAHLALMPTHWSDERRTAILFALNGVAFLLVVAWALVPLRGWRLLGGVLLLATVAAYVLYIGTGREDADLVGLLLNAVEIAGLAALLVGATRQGLVARLSWPLALALAGAAVIALGGLVAGTALHSASASAGAGNGQSAEATPMAGMADSTPMAGMASATPMAGMSGGMPALTPAQQAMAQQLSSCFGGQLPMPMSGDADMLMAPVPSGAPTADQQDAADSFAQQVSQGIAHYADVNTARAAGYRPLGPQIPNQLAHWINIGFMMDGDPLDPARPGALMFLNTSSGPQLVGAMFMMPGNDCPVDFGGPITDWHVHTNLCYNRASGGFLVGVETPARPNCPSGTFNHVSQWMLHVWTVPVPGGPFAQAEQVSQALRGH